MNTTGTYIPATIAAIVIMLAATTTTAFHSVTVSATPLISSEQAGSTNATTPETTGQEQSTIYIVKDGTNSYTISGSSSSVGSFDTTYRITGERSAIRSAENLIISTITDDFKASPTIGYIRATGGGGGGGGVGATGSTEATSPNPFATQQQITEKITSELRNAITQAESNTSQGQHVEIKCDFGMSLEDMRCHYGPLPQTR